MQHVQFTQHKMVHPRQVTPVFVFSRVPIEFPNKNFFTGKLESLWYGVYRRDLFLNWSSEVRLFIQLSYKRV